MAKRFSTRTVIFALIALIALVVVGGALREYMRIGSLIGESRTTLQREKATVDQLHFDADGNLSSDVDQTRFASALGTIQAELESIKMYKDDRKRTYPFMAIGSAVFLLFLVIAVLSARRPANATGL